MGIRADYGDRYWDVAVFDASYGDLVIWSNYTGSWKAYNVDSTAQGIELSSGLTLEQWRLGAAFTWLDAKDDETGFQLPKRAQRSARLSLDRTFEQGQIGMTLIGANGRATTLGSDEMLPGYVTLDLRASYDFAIDWNAELSVKNALDKEYQTAKDYINPGRGVFLTLNYSAF
ncbi:TonB-dependent receptor domain-containing protein [Marinomonas rhodophyticola]|uniref:TonB-dependent receptor n=1 Tax=Marinomonas rhodophyticola TaxID=2992803 RepID=A0ABT3KJ09_9GAMM|nr:TonB-dependent receptor [Marinomonas sp. KJ51-3]MCW4630500.1 TonB-dependent receptor [Marinomonas sp. KJ51-3]